MEAFRPAAVMPSTPSILCPRISWSPTETPRELLDVHLPIFTSTGLLTQIFVTNPARAARHGAIAHPRDGGGRRLPRDLLSVSPPRATTTGPCNFNSQRALQRSVEKHCTTSRFLLLRDGHMVVSRAPRFLLTGLDGMGMRRVVVRRTRCMQVDGRAAMGRPRICESPRG